MGEEGGGDVMQCIRVQATGEMLGEERPRR